MYPVNRLARTFGSSISWRIHPITALLPVPGNPCTTSNKGSPSVAFTLPCCFSSHSSFKRRTKCCRNPFCSSLGFFVPFMMDASTLSMVLLENAGWLYEAAELRFSSKGASCPSFFVARLDASAKCFADESSYYVPVGHARAPAHLMHLSSILLLR